MKDILLTYLPWVLPPLIGAAIGYITNAIAIAMLFRPYTAKRLLGCTVPMTPGIIPRQRYELSESIGRLVSRELLTEDALRGQIRSESFSRNIDKALRSLIQTLISAPLREIKASLAVSFGKRVSSDSPSVSTSIIMEVVGSFLSSEGFYSVIESFLDRGITWAGGKTLSSLVSAVPGFSENTADLIFSEGNRKQAAAFLRRAVERGIYRNVKFSSFLHPENIGAVTSALLKLYDLGFPRAVTWFRKPDVKRELELRGRFILEDILEKLNRVQRFFLSVGQYDRTLEENMGSIIDDILEQIKNAGTDPENREKLRSVIASLLERLIRTSFGELAAAWGESFSEDIGKAADFAVALFFTPSMHESVVRSVESFIERKGSETVEDLLLSWPGISLPGLRDKIIPLVRTFGTGGTETPSEEPSPYTALFSGIFNTLTGGGTYSLKEILNLGDTVQEKIGSLSSTLLLEIIDSKIPEILASVDVRTLVVNKIDSLDIEKVEELILEVVKKQLRWINLFGALLGALIGGAQIVLSRCIT